MLCSFTVAGVQRTRQVWHLAWIALGIHCGRRGGICQAVRALHPDASVAVRQRDER
ncbi:hypothetical protein PLANTIT3_70104 [Plantibacter sp. T3]|nr:hypothetical protein PLANTIT3_70104 [Plantibacter sp. T3]